MELFTSKICIYLTGIVFFITCLVGMSADVPVVTLAIRASVAAALCLVLSRILFRIFIEFFAKDKMGSNLHQYMQHPKEAINGGQISNAPARRAPERSEQKTNPK